MTVNFTIPLPLIVAYFAVGALIWLPLEYSSWRGIASPSPRPPFWRELWRALKRRPWVPFLVLVAWPIAVWQELR